MATLDKAEALLEELRVASVEAARRDLDKVAAFAAEQARNPYPNAYPSTPYPGRAATWTRWPPLLLSRRSTGNRVLRVS